MGWGVGWKAVCFCVAVVVCGTVAVFVQERGGRGGERAGRCVYMCVCVCVCVCV